MAIMAWTAVAVGQETFQEKFQEPPTLLKPEVSVDVYGTARFLKGDESTQLGGGIGINAFVTSHFGIGVEVESEDPESELFVESLNAKLIGRHAFGKLVPYGFVGGGYQFEAEDYTLFAGAGSEYKFNENVALFSDARWNIPNETTVNDGHVQARLGLRFTF